MKTALLALVCLSLIFATASAQGIVVPGDADGDMIVSDEELRLAEQSYSEGKTTSDELEEIRHIHDDYPKTIVDSADQEVTIYKPLKRVVIAYWIDAATTLQALNAEDIVIGVTQVIANDKQLFPELSTLPVVGDRPRVDRLDYEAILELEPDVIITGGAASTYDEIQRKVQSMNPNVAVLRFDYCVPSSYLEEVNKTGYLLDRNDEAKELIDFIDDHLTQIEETVRKIPSDERAQVYVEVMADYTTGGKGTACDEFIETAGGDNVFGDITADSVVDKLVVDPEEVIKRNPDIVICQLGSAYSGKKSYECDDTSAFREKREEILNRSGFEYITAIKNGDVYIFDSNILLQANYFVGIAYYAKCFYPDYFQDLDPKAIHQEYLSKFLGIDYELNKHGVFVYHPEHYPDGR